MRKMSLLYCSGLVPVFCFIHTQKIDTKEVVSAVKAESVVAKVAAVNPSKKMTDGISVK
jgi:hypothetical protein